MQICDICYAEIEKGDICKKCRKREKVQELKCGSEISDEEIVRRFRTMMEEREENIEKLIEKLDRCRKEYTHI